MINKISYKKLNLISLGAVAINILIYLGIILMELFINNFSNKEYVLLIGSSLILIISLVGLLSGMVGFLQLIKLKSNNITSAKVEIVLVVIAILINLGIIVYTFISGLMLLYFIRA